MTKTVEQLVAGHETLKAQHSALCERIGNADRLGQTSLATELRNEAARLTREIAITVGFALAGEILDKLEKLIAETA